MTVPLFPGGTAVSGLRVYDWESEDGVSGGTPHLHTVSTEGYVVLAGAGSVQTLSAGGAAEHPLAPGTLVWFSPGTIHRLVNDGGLELVVIMQNAGLPEAGDAVFTFPAEILADAVAYEAAASLSQDWPERQREQRARWRRNLALEGFRELRAAVEQHGPAALTDFHRRATELVRPRVERWRGLWAETVEAETERTRRQLEALTAGDGAHLADGTVVRGEPRPGSRLFGMCGRLQTWGPPEH
ncbi:cupin domain-containing protein [Lysobacter korlensis]|uniref:Cupin domain-containing protein n=1 Tax=Lysobacter korlensis TaxID=553636 RepID=A0ABV6RTA1_9GAMM